MKDLIDLDDFERRVLAHKETLMWDELVAVVKLAKLSRKYRAALQEIARPAPDTEVPELHDQDENPIAEAWCRIATQRRRHARLTLLDDET